MVTCVMSGDPTFALKYNSVAPTTSEICIEPNAMTFEDFLAGWTDDSAPGWVVSEFSQQKGGGGGREAAA
eukprot:2795519-Rhodomonas_salina.2